MTETEEIAGNSPQDTEENFDVPAVSSEPVSSQEPLPSMTPEVTETPVPSTVPEDNQDSTIVVESWTIDSDVLVLENEQYVLNLSASIDSPVTQDVVSSMLPSHVLIQDGSAVPVTWDISAIPEEGITGDGTYVVNGTLGDGYTFAEGVKTITVQVVTTGAEVLALNDDKYLVNDTVSPGGTVINLFDYWVSDDRFAADTHINAWDSNSGINQGHNLKFFSSADDDQYINSWKANNVTGGIKSGIVQNVLGEDGYPILSKQYSIDKKYGDSLNYLFNSSSEGNGQPGKTAYMDVKGLLQSGYTEDGEYNGYYYYDAKRNFAVFDETENDFDVYNTWGVKEGHLADSSNGQFFPFNSAADVFDESGNGLTQKDIYGDSNTLHHLFGLSMTSRFIQQNGGKNNGNPVIYDFSGDDDVWIFIDGVLVGDLGGVHNHAEISIDFSNGDIKITQYPQGNKNGITSTSTLKKNFTEAGKENSVTWSGNTFADDTYHTLSFFYLERGGGASNMKLKYNLVTVPESSIVKVDQTGDKIEGAGFELKIKSKTADTEEVVASGTTNANGTLVLLNPDTKLPIGLKDLRTKYDEFKTNNNNDAEIILYEKTIPPGYRGIQEVPLYFVENENVDEDILLVSDYWSNGSYAMPQVTTKLKSTVTYYDPVNHSTVGTIPLTAGSNEYDGKLFAVVLKKIDDTWRPISGTYEEGYTVAENGNMSSVIEAARKNWYPFQLTNSTAYEVNVTELPGDITRYYHFDQTNNAEYAVGYYYTTADSAAQITENNTFPIYYPGLTGSEENIEKRVFSSRIYVPNIKNRIIVQKLDDQNDGYYVAGAKFNLYKEDQVEQTNDGKYQLKANQTPYDTCSTSISMLEDQKVDLIGANSFPTAGKKLEYGTYFIQEAPLSEQSGYTIVHKDEQGNIVSEAVPPDAYMVNPALVKVVVDETGIYAYAGDEKMNDGVDVQYGVGAIVRSMLRFAEEDDIDTSLHDIIASLMTNTAGATANPAEQTYTKDEIQENLDLAYNASSALYEYGPVETGGKTAFTVDSGWAKVMIQQCQNGAHRVPSSSDFQQLGDRDLSNLFSRSVIVRVKNQSAGEFKLTNKVILNGRQQAYKGQSFQFNLQLDATSLDIAFDAALPDRLTAKVYDSQGKETQSISLKKEDNVYYLDSTNKTVSLKDGESILIEQLPAGISFAVSEVENTSYITDVSSQVVTMKDGTKQSLEGSNDPLDNPGIGIKPQSGTIYKSMRTEVTYINTLTEFVFIKVDETGKIPLSNAEFALYELKTDTADGYKNTVLKTDSAGKITEANQESDWDLIKVITSDEKGVVSFSGISYTAKEFRLVELTAPPGYTVPTGQWRIVYDKETKSFIPVKEASGVKNPPAIEVIDPKRDDGIQYQIRNYKPHDLPSSGNTGIGWFMKTGGALMISSALFIFFLAQRRKKHESQIASQE